MGNHHFEYIKGKSWGSISQWEIMGFYVSTGHHGFLFLNEKSPFWISQWEIMGFYFPMGNHSFEYLNRKSWGSLSQWEIMGFYFSMGNHLNGSWEWKTETEHSKVRFFMNNLVYFWMDLTWKTETERSKVRFFLVLETTIYSLFTLGQAWISWSIFEWTWHDKLKLSKVKWSFS